MGGRGSGCGPACVAPIVRVLLTCTLMQAGCVCLFREYIFPQFPLSQPFREDGVSAGLREPDEGG